MPFKYFKQPELFAGFVEGETACAICTTVGQCLDAGLFIGTDEITTICSVCLKEGKLYSLDIYTCNGDIEELKRQLKEIHHNLTDEEIDTIAKNKTAELEKATPAVISWQDWDWPCADGDYCQFIGYGSKPIYTKLADATDPKYFFMASLYYSLSDESNGEELWDEWMPEETIENYQQSNDYSRLFYVFKSLHSNKIITIWDCD